MNDKVPAHEAVTKHERALPPRVQEALGELVGVAREGLLALSVGVGLGVLAELMEEEVTEVVGPKGRHDPNRGAVRHGHRPGEVTLGGRRVGVERPRVRAADGAGELGLSVYQHFAERDPLSRIVLERMLAGVSCRRYGRVQEPLGNEIDAEARGVSKSAISRTFIERTRHALGQLMARRLDDVRLSVLMLRWDRSQGAHQHRGARDHLRGREDPTGVVGGIERERDCRHRVALGSRRARPRYHARGPVRDLVAQRPCARRSETSLASTPRYSAACATRNETSWVTCQNATDLGCVGGCGPPGTTLTTTGLWGGSSSLRLSFHAPIPELPVPCARGWPRRSP